jgi:hypothetical protein
MIPFLLAQPPLAVSLGLAYAAAGFATAALLRRQHAPLATQGVALLAWPLVVPMLWDAPLPRVADRGPLAGQIDAALDALEITLHDPAAGEVPIPEDTAALREALHRADERLGLVDRLLADTAPHAKAVGSGVASLQQARDRAAAEIEAVLAGVMELRVQVGLLTLAGNAAPVRDRLRELRVRIGSLDEVARLPGSA